MDSEATSQKSSERSRRSIAGLRQLSDDAKGFFKEQVAKAKHVRDDLRHKQGEPSTPTRVAAHSPSEVSPLVSPPVTPLAPSTPRQSRLSRKALPPHPKSSDELIPQQPTPALSSSKPKLHHLSAVRVGLTSLVVLHHTTIPYGGLGSWGWHSPSFPGTSLPLAAFNAVNQTWFMAGFFWMAGYFTHVHLRKLTQSTAPVESKSAEKSSKELGAFVCSRATRLVVPAMAYTLVVAPLAPIMILLSKRGRSLSLVDVRTSVETSFKTLRGLKGPVWFGALLFLFDAAAAALAALRPSVFEQWPSRSSPQRRYIFGALSLSAAAAFLIRLPFPVGAVFTPLNLQPAFLPQYILSYAVGHICAATGSMYLSSLYPYTRERPLSSIAVSLVTMALGLGAACVSTLSGTGRAMPLSTSWERLAGGLTLPAALYALWNELGFITILPSVVAICERYLNMPDLFTFRLPRLSFNKDVERKNVELPRYAYATFLVHPIVSFGVELLIEHFLMPHFSTSRLHGGSSWLAPCGPILATAAVGTLNVVASWTAGIALVECCPFIGRWI